MRTRGKAQGSASGGAIEAELIPGVSFVLPGIKVFNQTVAALPIEFFASMLGKSIGGIIGYDFIKQLVVEVNYQAKVMNVYAPASYKNSGSSDIVPIKFINKKPFVNVKIKPQGRHAVEGTFMIDTGADGAMTVNSPFVRTHQLLKSLTRIKQDPYELGSNKTNTGPLLFMVCASHKPGFLAAIRDETIRPVFLFLIRLTYKFPLGPKHSTLSATQQARDPRLQIPR